MEENQADNIHKEKGKRIKIIAQANSSKECPYLKTKPETINPIDHPIVIKLKKKKIR